MGDTDTDAGSIAYTNSDDTMTFRAAAGARMALDSTGIDVTGTVTAGGLTVDTSATGGFKVEDRGAEGAGVKVTAYQGTTNSNVRQLDVDAYQLTVSTGPVTGTTVTDRLLIADNGDISFYEDTGTTPKLVWKSADERLGIGTSSPEKPLHVNSGTGNIGVRVESSDATASIEFMDSGTTSTATSARVGGISNDFFVQTNGSERLRIDSLGGITAASQAGGHVVFNSNTVDADFRVAYNNGTHALYVDGATGNVGIGASSPRSLINASSATGAVLTLESSDTTLGENDVVGQIDFYANDASTNSTGNKAFIKAYSETAGGNKVGLDFATSGSDSATGVVAMTIDSSRNVGIGTSSPTGLLHLAAENAHVISKVMASTSGYDAELWLGRNDTRKAIIRAEQLSSNSEHDLVFFTNAASADATEKLRLGSNGAFAVKPTVGGHAVFNEDGVDADFRVESDSKTHMLFVDASTNRIGINKSTPAADVHLKQTGDIGTGNIVGMMFESGVGSQQWIVQSGLTGVSNSYFNIRDVTAGVNVLSFVNSSGAATFSSSINTNSDVVIAKSATGVPSLTLSGFAGANNPYSIINFYNEDGSQQGPNNAAQIKALAINTDGSGGSLAFHTSKGTGPNGADATKTLSIGGGGAFTTFPSAGQPAAFNEDGVDADFRVESDTNANAFHVDALTSIVGINTNNISSYTSSNALVSKGRDFALVGAAASGAISNHIRFWQDSGTAYEIARISTIVGAGQINRGEMEFKVNNGATLRSWLYVNYQGNVVFNEDGNESDFRVESDNNANMLTVDGSADLVTISGGSKVTNEILRVNGPQVVGTANAGLYAVGISQVFAASAAKYLRIQQDGNLFGGLTITATGDYSSVNAIGCFQKIYSIGANNTDTTLFSAGNVTVADLGQTSTEFSMGTPTKPNSTTIYIPLVNLNASYILNMSLTVEFRGRIEGISAIDIIAQ